MEQENIQALAGKSRPSQSPETDPQSSPPHQQARKTIDNDHEEEHEDAIDEESRDENINDTHPNARSRENQKSEQGGADGADEEAPLGAFDWQDLERRFTDEMNAQTEVEAKIQAEFRKLMEFYTVWQQTPALQEQDRCFKRLRTRIAYVEMRENELDGKRHHHEQVKRAFESALELLQQQFQA